MAEPVGLVLGTIALASLFSTCIECMDFFELCKSYEYDYGLACLKLSLLKSRLDTWGEAVGIDKKTCEREGPWVMRHEETVIHRSLHGIAGVFGNAQLLQDKYSLELRPRRSRKIREILASNKFIKAGRGTNGGTPTFSHNTSFLRRSTTWAIRDKRKFDELIADLEFFISNLESVLHRLDTMPSSAATAEPESLDSSYWSADEADKPYETSLNPKSTRIDQGFDANTCGPIVIRRENFQQEAEELPSSTTTSQPANSHEHTEQGHTWIVGETDKNAYVFHGVAGGAVLTPAPSGQTTSFRIDKMKGNSRAMGGAITSEDFNNFFNPPSRRRGQKKNKKSNAQ